MYTAHINKPTQKEKKKNHKASRRLIKEKIDVGGKKNEQKGCFTTTYTTET